MKKLIVIFISLSIIILFYSCSSGKYEPLPRLNRTSSIKMDISLDKKQFLEGEPIWLTVNLKNTGDVDDSIPYLINELDYNLILGLKIKGDSIHKIEYMWMYVEYIPAYLKIKPGEQIQVYVNLVRFYQNKFEKDYPNGYLSKGNYDVQCIFSSSTRADDYYYYVTIKSNQLSFSILEPLEEEGYVFNSLKDILKSKVNSDSLFKFYKENSSSAYAERIFAGYVYSKVNPDSAYLKECIEFLSNYPDSYYSYLVLVSYLKATQEINGYSLDNIKNCLKSLKNGLKSKRLLQFSDILYERAEIAYDSYNNRILKKEQFRFPNFVFGESFY